MFIYLFFATKEGLCMQICDGMEHVSSGLRPMRAGCCAEDKRGVEKNMAG